MRDFQDYFSRTFQDQSDFAGLSRSWNFQEKNSGLSRRRGNPVVTCLCLPLGTRDVERYL